MDKDSFPIRFDLDKVVPPDHLVRQIDGYIQGLLEGVKFKHTAYALDRDSRKAALARFLATAVGERLTDTEDMQGIAA